MTERERIKAIKAEIERLKYIQFAPILLCEDLITFIDDLPEPVKNGLILDGKTYEFAETGDNDFHCDECALRERCDTIFPCSVCEPFSIYGYFKSLEQGEAVEEV